MLKLDPRTSITGDVAGMIEFITLTRTAALDYCQILL